LSTEMLAQIIWSRLLMLHSDFRSLTLLHYSMLKSSCLCMTWFIKMARIKKKSSSYPWWNNCASYFVPYFCSNSGCKMHTFTRTVSVNKIRAVYMGWRSNEKNYFFFVKGFSLYVNVQSSDRHILGIKLCCLQPL